MATRVEVDEQLIADVMAITGAQSERDAVERGLRGIISRREQIEAIRSLRGLVPDWDGDLDQMRTDR